MTFILLHREFHGLFIDAILKELQIEPLEYSMLSKKISAVLKAYGIYEDIDADLNHLRDALRGLKKAQF